MSKFKFHRAVEVTKGSWEYLPFEVFREEILSVIPYPLPAGETEINEALAKPQYKDWPFGGCVLLFKNGTWVHVDESLDIVESSLTDKS